MKWLEEIRRVESPLGPAMKESLIQAVEEAHKALKRAEFALSRRNARQSVALQSLNETIEKFEKGDF